jgi:hypothetical protein
MSEIEPYQPSNGSEGEWFLDKHCMQCRNCDPDPEGEKQCGILMRSMCYTPRDPEYPKEWIYRDGKPTCTSWEKWNWSEQGNPDDPANEKEKFNPNQLNLF